MAWDGRKFAIVMPWGRVGSNLVVGVLEKCAGVWIANEPTTSLMSQQATTLDRAFTADRLQCDYLRTFPPAAEEWAAKRVTKFGAKLSHRSFVSPMCGYEIMREAGYRIVAMDRRNHLKSAVSQIRAEQRAKSLGYGAFAVRSSEAKPAPSRLPVQMAIQRARVFESNSALMHGYLDHLFGDAQMKIYYEDLAAAPEHVIREIAAYLEIALPGKVKLPHRKATSDQLSEDIVNFDEFESAVRETEFAHLLEG